MAPSTIIRYLIITASIILLIAIIRFIYKEFKNAEKELLEQKNKLYAKLDKMAYNEIIPLMKEELIDNGLLGATSYIQFLENYSELMYTEVYNYIRSIVYENIGNYDFINGTDDPLSYATDEDIIKPYVNKLIMLMQDTIEKEYNIKINRVLKAMEIVEKESSELIKSIAPDGDDGIQLRKRDINNVDEDTSDNTNHNISFRILNEIDELYK
nr:MAG TPA: hypothetical protein [Caudoviricetes sp.]